MPWLKSIESCFRPKNNDYGIYTNGLCGHREAQVHLGKPCYLLAPAFQKGPGWNISSKSGEVECPEFTGPDNVLTLFGKPREVGKSAGVRSRASTVFMQLGDPRQVTEPLWATTELTEWGQQHRLYQVALRKRCARAWEGPAVRLGASWAPAWAALVQPSCMRLKYIKHLPRARHHSITSTCSLNPHGSPTKWELWGVPL